MPDPDLYGGSYLDYPSPPFVDRGRKVIQDFVSDNPRETRGQGFNALDIGSEIRDAYMDQRGSGLPLVNKGMNISDFLKSEAASNIASKYGNVLDADQAYEEWIRSQTAPGTVDTRNQYQLGMNQLRGEYPEAYAEEFPWADAMMKGLPAIAKLALGKLTGGATTALSAMGQTGQNLTGMLQNFGLMADEDEEYPPWMWWKKAKGGIASLNGGGSWYGNPHMDPPSYTPSTPSYGGPDPHGGETAINPTPEVLQQQLADQANLQSQEDHLQAALSLAAAGQKGIGWGEAEPGEFDLTNTLGVNVPGLTEGTPGEVFTFNQQGLVDDTPIDTTGGEPSPTYDRHPGGTRYSGAPLLGEGEVEQLPQGWEEYLKEKGKKQFDTQFMASQYLYDKSRGRFDQGGLADMSENALGEFDVARSTWKWKYDNKINELMDGGFSLKEAIDELWNKGWGMPYKGFSLKERA